VQHFLLSRGEAAAGIAKVLFLIFLVIWLLAFVTGRPSI
jgi:uncharacterized membrane protein YtjA (UPF0391 family)